MRSRSYVVSVVALAWLFSLAAATFGGATAEQGQQPAKDRAPPFRHSTHVVKEWGEDFLVETFRDCRGCHQFGPDAAVSSPQAGCKDCHYGTGALDVEFEPGSERDLSAFASRSREGFRHHTHGMLQCAECHRGEPDEGVPDSIPIRTGPGECARCHEASQARAAAGRLRWLDGVDADAALARACGLEGVFQPPSDLDAYAEKLDRVFAGEGEGLNKLLSVGGGDFAHGDHQQLSCKECHSGIPGAAADEVGTGAIDVAQCAECHQRSGGAPNPAADPEAGARRPSWSLGAFAHADHFDAKRSEGVCLESGYAPFEGAFDRSCQHCHEYGPERPGFPGRDFPFDGEQSKHRYRNCQECHAVPAWQTGELVEGRAPLHTSNSGDLSGWIEQRCDQCHVFGAKDMLATRPEVPVARWTSKTYVFDGQTHPYITGDLDKDCSACHRAAVPALPTRLIDKQFRHETHLPPPGDGFDNAQCVGCHKSAVTSESSGALADASFRTYDLGVCADCHKGSQVVEQVEAQERPQPRSAVAFPHKQHVAHLDCTACHERGEDDIVTLESALRCSDCHNHDSSREGPVGDLVATGAAQVLARLRTLHHVYDEQVESCANCHHDAASPEVDDVPAIRGTLAAESDPRYAIEPLEFGGFVARQHHPLGSRCVDCHRADQPEGAALLASIEVAPTNVVYSGRPRGRRFHDGAPEASFEKDGEQVGCMSCHWKPMGGGPGIGRYNQYRPAADATRERLGNDFAGWPGVNARGR